MSPLTFPRAVRRWKSMDSLYLRIRRMPSKYTWSLLKQPKRNQDTSHSVRVCSRHILRSHYEQKNFIFKSRYLNPRLWKPSQKLTRRLNPLAREWNQTQKTVSVNINSNITSLVIKMKGGQTVSMNFFMVIPTSNNNNNKKPLLIQFESLLDVHFQPCFQEQKSCYLISESTESHFSLLQRFYCVTWWRSSVNVLKTSLKYKNREDK